MKTSVQELIEAADAHEARMASANWARSDGDEGDSWADSLASVRRAAPERSRAEPTAPDWSPDGRASESQPRLDSLERGVETLTDAVKRRPAGSEAFPGWLELAAGNPHTYDSPDPTRMGVFARIRPATYDRLRAIQRRIGLRTTAGAWEFLLRLGLAAAERLPGR